MRATGTWRGFEFDTSDVAPLDPDEPIVVMIHGVLRVRHARTFYRYNAKAVAHAESHPAYLGGLGLADTPMTTTSFSFWRSAAGSRDFAFGAGAHAPAAKASRGGTWHDEECFVRFRPLRVEGTLAGRNPMGDRVLVAA